MTMARESRHPLSGRMRGLRWTARDVWAGHASYLAVARFRHSEAAVGPDTQLVIEGFPRTANTFSVFAFQMAQPAPVRVAHHLHAPVQVIAAAKARIPVLVLIRPPEDAVLSLATWSPHIGLEQALRAYSRFYERVARDRSWCVTGEFTQVTSDLGLVIDAVNGRYETAFARFEHTPQNVEACYALIEEKSCRPPWAAAITRYVSGTITAQQLAAARAAARGAGGEGQQLSEARVARPSTARAAAREQMRGHYHHPRLARLRERAERAHNAFGAARAASAGRGCAEGGAGRRPRRPRASPRHDRPTEAPLAAAAGSRPYSRRIPRIRSPLPHRCP